MRSGQSSPSGNIKRDNVVIPNGKLAKTNIKSSLLYDEFVIYDANQISLKYLVVVKKV